jgi:hypothetical protein
MNGERCGRQPPWLHPNAPAFAPDELWKTKKNAIGKPKPGTRFQPETSYMIAAKNENTAQGVTDCILICAALKNPADYRGRNIPYTTQRAVTQSHFNASVAKVSDYDQQFFCNHGTNTRYCLNTTWLSL